MCKLTFSLILVVFVPLMCLRLWRYLVVGAHTHFTIQPMQCLQRTLLHPIKVTTGQ